ncbi:MAG TPA: MEDS domain-containing protein [Candidatus Thermoplasmatota archaeon]|nr:MEDS domain-containing protein [Candidatus Thermoplasmatota archaeon]
MISRRPQRAPRPDHGHEAVQAVGTLPAPPTLMLRPTQAAEHEPHYVLLYTEESALVDAMGSWAEAGLNAGEGVILIVRAGIAQRVRGWLQQADMDPASFETVGRLRILDADGTLRLFMMGGTPQANLFQNVIAPLLEDVRKASPAGTVRAWGEMVDLLWKRAQGPAAVKLEGLWNDLIGTHHFHLFCAYQADAFDTLQFPKVRAIAATHGVLLPAEDDARFAAAVDQALTETYGPEADAVRAFLAQGASPRVPIGFHRLLALHDLAPDFAAIVAARAGLHYRARPA